MSQSTKSGEVKRFIKSIEPKPEYELKRPEKKEKAVIPSIPGLVYTGQ